MIDVSFTKIHCLLKNNVKNAPTKNKRAPRPFQASIICFFLDDPGCTKDEDCNENQNCYISHMHSQCLDAGQLGSTLATCSKDEDCHEMKLLCKQHWH